jgi:hypothetical protein
MYLALIFAKLGLHDGNLSEFAQVGSDFADSRFLPSSYPIKAGSGADGQFYLRLAFEPFTRVKDAYGIELDNPPYRQQRILYPLLAWLLSLGIPTLVPAMLVAINFAAVCALAWIGTRLARSFGRAAGWGILLPLYPGLAVSFARDLTEVVAVCLLAAALLALMNKRFVLATVLLCGGVLTRETTVLVAACLLVASAWLLLRGSRTTAVPLYVSVAPAVVFGAWQAILWTWWRVLPLAAGGANFAPPLSGVIGFAHGVGAWPFSVAGWVRLLELLGSALVTLAALLSFRSTQVAWPLRIAWVGYGVLALVLSSAVWRSEWHALRALVEWHLLGLLILLGARNRLARLPLLLTLPIWYVTFIQVVAD